MADIDAITGKDEVVRSLTLLVHASRVSPQLRQAVAVVEAEIERLRAERARVVKPAERPWQVAFRLHRAGFRVHSKYVQPGWVTCWYQHPHQGIGATIDVRGSEVGRGGAR